MRSWLRGHRSEEGTLYLLRLDLANPEGKWFAEAEEGEPVADAAISTILEGFSLGGELDAEDEEDPREDEDADDGGILDFRVLYASRHARVFAVVDAPDWETAMRVGVSLARHVCMYSPQMLDWHLEALNVQQLAERFDGEHWLPPNEVLNDRPHDLAERLPREVLELSNRYLVAGAVRDLWDRAGTGHTTVPISHLLAGDADLPWRRDLTSAVVDLLAAARLVEMAADGVAPLQPGPGEDGLAEDLLRRTRALSASDLAADDLLTFKLLEQWTADHDLEWNTVDDRLDQTMQDFRDDTNHRAVLGAGVRVIATLAGSLASKGGSTYDLFVALGATSLEQYSAQLEQAERRERAAEDADAVRQLPLPCLVVLLALMDPAKLDTDAGSDLVDEIVWQGSDSPAPPLHFFVIDVLYDLGHEALASAITTRAGARRLAAVVVPLLRAFDDDDDRDPDAFDAAVGEYLTGNRDDDELDDVVKRTLDALDLIGAAQRATDSEARQRVRGLLSDPLQTSATVSSLIDETPLIRQVLRALLAEAATRFGPAVTALAAGLLPELHSDDPRDEGPLRAEAHAWVARAAQIAGSQAPELNHQVLPELVTTAATLAAEIIENADADTAEAHHVFGSDMSR
jgi:hypothetical protein